MAAQTQTRAAPSRCRAAPKLRREQVGLGFCTRTACCSGSVCEFSVLLRRHEFSFRGRGPNHVTLVIEELKRWLTCNRLVGKGVQAIQLFRCQGAPEAEPSVNVTARVF